MKGLGLMNRSLGQGRLSIILAAFAALPLFYGLIRTLMSARVSEVQITSFARNNLCDNGPESPVITVGLI